MNLQVAKLKLASQHDEGLYQRHSFKEMCQYFDREKSSVANKLDLLFQVYNEIEVFLYI